MKKIQSNLNVSTEDPLKIWDLTERLGEGGVGTVWKAINKRNGQVAAVKIIALDGNDEGLEDILIEINILKDCQHEHVVGYYGSYLNKNKELWVRDARPRHPPSPPSLPFPFEIFVSSFSFVLFSSPTHQLINSFLMKSLELTILEGKRRLSYDGGGGGG
jgi:serine/threonine protein kinase